MLESLKLQLYEKTKRIDDHTFEWLVTEKLDGSNLTLFRDGACIVVALRNYLYWWQDDSDLTANDKGRFYPGLLDWLHVHRDKLWEVLWSDVAVCGEWLGQGHLKYPESFARFNIFAVASVYLSLDSESDLHVSLANYNYDPLTFGYGFRDGKIPDYIGSVPVVARTSKPPSVAELDALYDTYSEQVGRPVEGLVVSMKNVPQRRCKYLRMKNGSLRPHQTEAEIQAEREERERAHASRGRRKGKGRKEGAINDIRPN